MAEKKHHLLAVFEASLRKKHVEEESRLETVTGRRSKSFLDIYHNWQVPFIKWSKFSIPSHTKNIQNRGFLNEFHLMVWSVDLHEARRVQNGVYPSHSIDSARINWNHL